MIMSELLSGKVEQVIKTIEAGAEAGMLDVAALTALHEAESAGNKRQTVLAVLARLLDEAANKPSQLSDEEIAEAAAKEAADAAAAEAAAAGKAARGEKPAEKPAWQKPDYHGPITIDQAEWRSENIKAK
jgi:peptidoglycan hydrolase CwlO-like protein